LEPSPASWRHLTPAQGQQSSWGSMQGSGSASMHHSTPIYVRDNRAYVVPLLTFLCSSSSSSSSSSRTSRQSLSRNPSRLGPCLRSCISLLFRSLRLLHPVHRILSSPPWIAIRFPRCILYTPTPSSSRRNRTCSRVLICKTWTGHNLRPLSIALPFPRATTLSLHISPSTRQPTR